VALSNDIPMVNIRRML